MLYIREDIPSQLLKQHCKNEEFENFFVEINVRKKKWLIKCSYNPKTNDIAGHLNHVSKNLDRFSSKYENYIIMDDFNAEIRTAMLKNFVQPIN